MIRIYCEEVKKRKPLFDVLQIFFKKQDILFCDTNADLSVNKDMISYGRDYPYADISEMKQILYTVLSNTLQQSSPWGILTGSKPMKLYRQVSPSLMKERYFVSDEKIQLMERIAEVQSTLRLKKPKINLYLNIPFCATRCAYCSFPTIVKPGYHAHYVQLLKKEIREMSKFTGRKVRTVYFGGGTPTVLSARQLEELFETIGRFFDLSELEEWTVEAGREDSLTEEKLRVMQKANVTRISLNPQTFHPKVLQKIGRRQDNEQLVRWYYKAKESGFLVNMDFILGLESEAFSHVKYNMTRVKELSPDHVTIHTLALKKGSKYEERAFESLADIKKAVDYTRSFLMGNGWEPYYLYRQKQILGNFENIGYTKKGKSSIYNILINEELETIVGLGMTANSKFIGSQISYYTNPKDLNTYEETLNELIMKKGEMLYEDDRICVSKR